VRPVPLAIDLNWIDVIGYGSTALTVATYAMKTIVPLRLVSIATSLFSIAYASTMGVWPMLLTSLLVLPLNLYRLYQILKLMRQIRDTPDGQYLAEWLHPFSSRRMHKAGDVVFSHGDKADYMLLIEGGRYRLPEIGKDYVAGGLVGEVGFVTHDNRRTLTLVCVEDGVVGQVSYSDLRQLYFQNQKFGYYFLQLLGSHLVDRLEEARARSNPESAPEKVAAE
jgi:CRP/FNR family transcriptional regulator, cyclic AMP receptor protein